MRDSFHISLSPGATAAAVAALVLLPIALNAVDQSFYIVLATRILIFGLIATSLNLVIGYAGMISFGHAAFVGAGAYTAALLIRGGFDSAWIAWPSGALAGALLALVVGAVSLRTRGVYFIMITLAFAQMVYYVIVSLKILGGDDGLNVPHRPVIGLGVDLRSDAHFYYVVLAIFVLLLAVLRRFLNAGMGRAIQGIRDNETRMEAIGFATYRLKLSCFVAAGAVAGLGGGMIAALNGFVSPSLLQWQQSGLLMVMVILGGAGRFLGGMLGAAVLLGADEILSDYTTHGSLGVGIVLLLVVLVSPQGLSSLVRRQLG